MNLVSKRHCFNLGTNAMFLRDCVILPNAQYFAHCVVILRYCVSKTALYYVSNIIRYIYKSTLTFLSHWQVCHGAWIDGSRYLFGIIWCKKWYSIRLCASAMQNNMTVEWYKMRPTRNTFQDANIGKTSFSLSSGIVFTLSWRYHFVLWKR